MDRKLADILEKQADLTKQPFIQNDITERLLEKTGGEGLYTKFTIDLSVAHTDEKYTFHGDRLTVENVDDAVTIKLNSRKNDPIDLPKIPEIHAPIKCFFVTNDAGSGNLKLLCGSKGMFEAKKKPENNIKASYLIVEVGSYSVAIDGSTGDIVKTDTDATTVIQYALDNLTSGRTHRETVAFKGSFTIAAAIDIPSYTTLDFNGASLILGTAAGVHMLQIGDGTTGVTDVEIMHGIFDGNKAGQAGIKHCIYAQDKCQKLNIHDNYFTNWYGKGISINGGSGADVCYDITITSNMMNGFQPGIDSDGIDLDQVAYATVANNVIRDAGDDGIDCGAGTDVNIIGNALKDCENGIEVYSTVGIISDNSIDKSTAVGIVIDTSLVAVTGNYISNTYTHAIDLRYGHDCTISGNVFWRSSFGANNTSSDIHLTDKAANHSIRNTITGNVSRADGGNKVKYMIEEADANQDYNIISDNISSGAVTAAILKQGVNTLLSNNIGHVTENSGASGAIADGGTIAHGLATTPTHAIITGSVAGEIVNVTGLGAANLTIAIKNNAGAAGTNQVIYWRAWV